MAGGLRGHRTWSGLLCPPARLRHARGAPRGVALPGARWGALCPFWIFHFFFSRTSSSVHPNKRMFPIPLASLLRLPRLEDGARLTPKVHPGLGTGRPVWPWARGMALVERASSRFRLPVQASSRSQAGVGKRAQRHPAGAPRGCHVGGTLWAPGRGGHGLPRCQGVTASGLPHPEVTQEPGGRSHPVP